MSFRDNFCLVKNTFITFGECGNAAIQETIQ